MYLYREAEGEEFEGAKREGDAFGGDGERGERVFEEVDAFGAGEGQRGAESGALGGRRWIRRGAR